MKPFALLLLMAMLIFPAQAVLAEEELSPLSITLEGYGYPYPVQYLPLSMEGQDLRMAYMDIHPQSTWNGKTVLLLHGKNFFGAYWKDTIAFLADKGYRVVVPDQIGFGKSSKPNIHYSFHALAANTRKLLDKLDIREVMVVGHSMGGMLATRFALMYPETATGLVLENPIGLEDYRRIVPYIGVDDQYQSELNATAENIRAYHKSYFVVWQPEYGEYAEVAARQKLSGEFPRLALSSALTYEMIYEQPVCHEFKDLKAKTLLVIGQSDRTVVGKARVKKELLPTVGQYPELGRRTAQLIPGARLVEIPNVGHIPHIEKKERFHAALLEFLSGP
ncbi:alpha/beta fold hydrolase [Geobacter sp. SVR]|uniref:alpha/beta fold hydrolase n=1 Tax=Geobacter sp. SVR TaxID=2495594 RepID=UPI00143EF6F4|nr:alpha/beta hydrolase [Geobacter sp. SVR]BCS54400.1 hydrolase [Geobacter sp. SVR]GCF87431.1 hydrolase [Geobacter sp. SVR]